VRETWQMREFFWQVVSQSCCFLGRSFEWRAGIQTIPAEVEGFHGVERGLIGLLWLLKSVDNGTASHRKPTRGVLDSALPNQCLGHGPNPGSFSVACLPDGVVILEFGVVETSAFAGRVFAGAGGFAAVGAAAFVDAGHCWRAVVGPAGVLYFVAVEGFGVRAPAEPSTGCAVADIDCFLRWCFCPGLRIGETLEHIFRVGGNSGERTDLPGARHCLLASPRACELLPGHSFL